MLIYNAKLQINYGYFVFLEEQQKYNPMNNLKYISIALILIITACNSSKTVATQSQKDKLKSIVDNKEFRVESEWAYPMVTTATQRVMNSGLLNPGDNASAMNLLGNPNFLEIKGDSITSFLPYFGERQMQVAYGGQDSAIEFNGLMENYEVMTNKHEGYDINFEAKSNSENFNVTITLYPNEKVDMILNGNSRFPIRYSGNQVQIGRAHV